MHETFSTSAFEIYNQARDGLIKAPAQLIQAESWLTADLARILVPAMQSVQRDYDAASILYPFWRNYPPENRGRAPIGDQYPWIEVGEHAVGAKLSHLLRDHFEVQDLGFPTGADQRFVIRSSSILDATGGLTDAIWLLVDIKSVGPRDDQDHTVMSHNQVSGSGEWRTPGSGVTNVPMQAIGARASHLFYPALPPLLVLPSGDVALTVTMALKPVYEMLQTGTGGVWTGQPLSRVDLITIPNGLLLTQNPNYLAKYPGLLFPGKDDNKKAATKVRARVSFDKLRRIDVWRYRTVEAPN